MEQLSLKRYWWKCVLGTEIAYALCLAGGLLPWRTDAGIVIHHAFFEMLPGFAWIDINSILLGAAYMFVFSWIFAWYMVWMYNTSLVHK